jgi:hypothetical protein
MPLQSRAMLYLPTLGAKGWTWMQMRRLAHTGDRAAVDIALRQAGLKTGVRLKVEAALFG